MVNEMLHIDGITQTTLQHKSIKITNIIMNSFQLQLFKKLIFYKINVYYSHHKTKKDFADQPNSVKVTESIYRLQFRSSEF